ncbi:EVE domain-containing protein [Pseudochelatococcus contaminans]|uniref:Putative RNA-binding protein with PUA-like domain n=1 Tax=Pseudochelatococcus contaminans TaxID=1538103 RepID=A0A7W5Z2X4_9HYPH|nr:EVE domain-containing protein [Pseudochelatococcus contaminans]MBB3808824.1 putative RNA-binding protein with PUA-like domain [Pseudochelatococcus contaminans]
MAHWLYKSEPDVWSWDQQVARGDAGEHWNGVRNYLARKHLQAMKNGDLGFFYHSNQGKAIVGIVEVIREYYPDHTDESGRFGMVDLKAVRPLKHPVTLDEIKQEPRLSDMILVNNSRLSVQPVTDEEWQIVLELSER